MTTIIFLFGAIDGYDFINNLQIVLTIWISVLFLGMTIAGFGKVIELIDNIKNK